MVIFTAGNFGLFQLIMEKRRLSVMKKFLSCVIIISFLFLPLYYLKSKDMAENNYFSHTSPAYGSPFDMMQSLGVSYSAAGENIALNTSVKGAYDSFMNSAGHRANILNANFGKAGLGFYQKGSYLYVTQWFTN